MALYTIIFQFRRRVFAHQVEAASVMDALARWFADLETRRIPNFGPRSRERLAYALERTGPTADPGMEGVHTWHGGISGFTAAVYIVETARSERRSKRIS